MANQRKILIPVDESKSAQKAFDFYLENLRHTEDKVYILHVHQSPHLSTINIHEPLQLPVAEWSKKLTESIEKGNKLIAHFEMLCEEKKLQKQTILGQGKPGEAICDSASKENVNMIVMGSRGQNALRRTFMGSVSDYVLHHTHVPVTIVPPE